MYQGLITIIDNRLQGRFGTNIEIHTREYRFKIVCIIITKIVAMYNDYFVWGSDKAIYFNIKNKGRKDEK